MKANENNGRMFNKSAYTVLHEVRRAEVHEEKAPINEVWKVGYSLIDFRKALFEIGIREWDLTSMESLYRLDNLIREVSDIWTYICTLDDECVKCDRYIIQAEMNFMIERISEETCIHHHDEYKAYTNSISDNKTSSDNNDDVDTGASDDSVLGTIEPISNNNVYKSSVAGDQAIKLTEPFDGGLVNWDDMFKHAAYVARHIFIDDPKENNVPPTNDEYVENKTRPSKDEYYSDDSQSESDDKTPSFVDSILGPIKPISNNNVHKTPAEVYQAMKLDKSTPLDGLIDWNDAFWADVFASIASRAWHFPDVGICTKENNGEHVEKKTRPSKDEYYLGIAEAVSARSTCLRIHYGSIICNNDRIVSSGYNGAPMGAPNCDEVGECYRVKNNIPHFTRYETCQSVHSEMNAIINASRTDMLGGTLYLVGKDVSSGSYVEGDCCPMCRRAVINAGISQVVFRTKDGGIRKVNVSDWTNDCMFNND